MGSRVNRRFVPSIKEIICGSIAFFASIHVLHAQNYSITDIWEICRTVSKRLQLGSTTRARSPAVVVRMRSCLAAA